MYYKLLNLPMTQFPNHQNEDNKVVIKIKCVNMCKSFQGVLGPLQDLLKCILLLSLFSHFYHDLYKSLSYSPLWQENHANVFYTIFSTSMYIRTGIYIL